VRDKETSPHHPMLVISSPFIAEEVAVKTYFILSAMGKDRPGMVADVAESFIECGGNIEVFEHESHFETISPLCFSSLRRGRR